MFKKFIILTSIYLLFIIAMSVVLGVFGAEVDTILKCAGGMLAAPFGIIFLLIMCGFEFSYGPQEKEEENGKESSI